MNHAEIAADLRRTLRGRVDTGRPLAALTTYRLGGPAGVYVEPADRDDASALAARLREADVDDIPLLIVGRGSNLVVSDRGFDGIVVHLAHAFSYIEDDGPSVAAGAATPLPQLANRAARRGLAGVEFLIAIPGSVGGAVRMNAGAHGVEIKDRLGGATVLSFADGEVADRPGDGFDFGYRRSNLGDRELVLEARFDLTPGSAAGIKRTTEAHRRHRAATQPGALQNAGSVFKNPPGDHAGRLVESAGLKGASIGEARVSELHANFFIAGDGARAQDVYELVNAVRARVRDRSGVDLQPEIRFVGPFDPPSREIEVAR